MLQVENLHKTYFIPRPFRKALPLFALRGVSFSLKPGKTLAVVGESGCGKSTMAKVLMGLEPASGGTVRWDDQNLFRLSAEEKLKISDIVQMVFQDTGSSLNPRKRIFDTIAEPLKVRGVDASEISTLVQKISEEVGIRQEWLQRFPHMLSGGQKQRVGIARALITRPKVIICDEPVSALDISVQAQVLNLLYELQEKYQLSYLFISHDLGVVRFIAHEVAVLYLGQVVEQSTTEKLFTQPYHPYTKMLLKSIPKIDYDEKEFAESQYDLVEMPSPMSPPTGCSFRTRCQFAKEKCGQEMPALRQYKDVMVACHFVEEIKHEVFL